MGLDTRGQTPRNNGFWGPTGRIGRVPGGAWGHGAGSTQHGPCPAAGHIVGATPQGGSAQSVRVLFAHSLRADPHLLRGLVADDVDLGLAPQRPPRCGLHSGVATAAGRRLEPDVQGTAKV